MGKTVGFDRDTELLLHSRLLKGDPTAPPDVVDKFLDPLVKALKANYVNLRDGEMFVDAAVDAILNYAQNPTSYLPAKCSLWTYLNMSAEGDLLNAIKSRKNRREREIAADFVEQREESGNNKESPPKSPIATDPTPLQLLVRKDIMQIVNDEITDPRDRMLLELLIDGERTTFAYAKVLGITSLPEKEQQKIVKRNKDRLNKQLRRLGKKLN